MTLFEKLLGFLRISVTTGYEIPPEWWDFALELPEVEAEYRLRELAAWESAAAQSAAPSHANKKAAEEALRYFQHFERTRFRPRLDECESICSVLNGHFVAYRYN